MRTFIFCMRFISVCTFKLLTCLFCCLCIFFFYLQWLLITALLHIILGESVCMYVCLCAQTQTYMHMHVHMHIFFKTNQALYCTYCSLICFPELR